MSWNNIATRYGTGISALTVDDNELHLRVTPAAPGQPPALLHPGYFAIDNRAVTTAAGKSDLKLERLPGSDRPLLAGTMVVGDEPAVLQLGIDDPAHYAAWRLKTLLEQRGVRVTGQVRVRHRRLSLSAEESPASTPLPLARLTPPPIEASMALINKPSQNVHSELLLRRLGAIRGNGSLADGVAQVRAMLEQAGVTPRDAEISDGSGMSTYNRISPRGMVKLLRWIDAQPWAGRWRASLPVAGVDGTLAARFRDTPLQGRLFAKTGTLNATNALAGSMVAASGRTLRFAVYANDVPGDAGSTAAIDRALLIIAAEN